jgi:hypothetical protein
MAWGFRLHIAKPLNGRDLIERASVVLESAVVPIKDASAVQRRLQIPSRITSIRCRVSRSKLQSRELLFTYGARNDWKQFAHKAATAISK